MIITDPQSSSKQSTSSHHAIKVQRTAKPLKLVPIDLTTISSREPSTSQSKVSREEKEKSKTAPPGVPISNARTPLTFVSHPQAARSRSASGSSSEPSRSTSSTSNVVKNAPATRQSSRTKAKPNLTAKQIRERYRGMVLRDFLQDIFQRKEEGEFKMGVPFLRGKVFFYCPQDYSSVTETSRKRSELVSFSSIHDICFL